MRRISIWCISIAAVGMGCVEPIQIVQPTPTPTTPVVDCGTFPESESIGLGCGVWTVPVSEGMTRYGNRVVPLDGGRVAITGPGDGVVTPDFGEIYSNTYVYDGLPPVEANLVDSTVRGYLPDAPGSNDLDTTLGVFAYLGVSSDGAGVGSLVLVDDTLNPYLDGDNARLYDFDVFGSDLLLPRDASSRFPLDLGPLKLARCGDLTGDGIADLCTTDGVYAGPLGETPTLTVSTDLDHVAACPEWSTDAGVLVKEGDAIHYVRSVAELVGRTPEQAVVSIPGDLVDLVCVSDGYLAVVDGTPRQLVGFGAAGATIYSVDYVDLEVTTDGTVLGLSETGRVDVLDPLNPGVPLRSFDTHDGAHTFTLYDADLDGSPELVLGFPELEHPGAIMITGGVLTIFGW